MKQAVTSATSPIPPLENGDDLGRAEFGRRYQAYPQIKKAELMERTVYILPPVRVRKRGVPPSDIISWLSTYRAGTLLARQSGWSAGCTALWVGNSRTYGL